ncbi:chromate transporter [Caldisalinibacter kiritimatiensis]|uniref:Chromate transport protein n=1 Tax=Caldisalinibacter kiritimatiensis TaxID=1304284 RepID=R1CSY8_9FIRM|nr:chromate transporter [Caldisalinibacter kiritimatiensis]EOD01766.1 Chromate transport protein [Caldisalinibacter kiritimatiensis]
MPQLLKLFITFLKIGAFTFGGGYAMIPLIETEVVDKNGWLESEEFLDVIAISQSAPGAIAVNSSLFIGYRVSGTLGALACMLGVVLPSFIIILIISAFLYQYRDNRVVEKIFLGVRPAVVALIASAVYKLIKTSKIERKLLIVSLLALIGILVGVSPVVEIILAGLGGVAFLKYKERTGEL